MSRFTRVPVLVLFGVFLLLLSVSSFAVAMEPPAAGEIDDLKQRGEFAARLDHARAIGNHRIDRDLLDRAVTRARRTALSQQGVSPSEVDQAAPLFAPPPAWQGMPTTGTVKILALLIDFSDYPASNTRAAIDSALFGDGSLVPSNAAPYESLASYYARSSYGQLSLAGGVTLGWYRPAYTRASLSMTTAARENLIKEALGFFDAAGQDFSPFDNNGDGKIDYFAVIWAGPDNGWANFWWGYQTSFSDHAFTVDGKTLGKYSWQWEYKAGAAYAGPFSPRVIIHETGHALGLPDYYDYDDAVGPRGGVGGLDMMDANWGDHNGFSKWVLDWLSPTVVASGSQSVLLDPSATTPEGVLIMPEATAGDPFHEFFIAQNRYRTGNDAGYPTSGLLIWHVDARLDPSGADYLYDNSSTPHKLLKLMQADGLDRIENSAAFADAAMYYTAGKTMSPFSVPSSRDYLGVDTRVNVTDIAAVGEQVNATFGIDPVSTLRTLTVSKSGPDAGTVTSFPAGVACGVDCAESFAPGSAVTLTAQAAPGAVFTGWTGGGCSGVGSCSVTLAADVAVTAAFSTTMIVNENFDALVLPSGWTRLDNAAGGFWWFLNASGYGNPGGSGGYAIGTTYAANPSYDIELRTGVLNLSGYACAGVEFKSDLSLPTADVDLSLGGAAGPWTNVWRKTTAFRGPATVDVDLTALAAGYGNAMLRFRTYGAAGVRWLLDDVKVMAASVCLPGAPTGVSATSTKGSATVSFTAPTFTGGSAITGYTVTSSPPGGVDQDAGTTATTHHVTGLTNETTYTFTVAASNGTYAGPDSAPSNSVTPGVAFSETFDGVSTPSLPSGWLAVAAGGAGGTWLTNVGTHQPYGFPAHSGSNLAFFNSYFYQEGAAVALISPAFSLTGVASGKIRFWMYRDAGAADDPDRVDVFVNTAASLTGATPLGTVIRPTTWPPAVAGDGWYRYEYPIPGSFAGGGNYLIIKGTSSWGKSIHIDDVQVVDEDDRTAPTVIGAASSTANGSYKAGAAVDVSVSFSEAISAAGLTINLNSGASLSTGALNGVANYTGTYTVGAGETAADLSIVSIAGTILDTAANDTVDPAVPAGQNIGDRKAIAIDTTAPTVTISSPSAAQTRSGPVSYTVTFGDANLYPVSLPVGNVIVNASGTASGTVGVSGSGATRTVTISGVTGAGSLGISLVAGAARDYAGNTTPVAGPSATFTIDGTAPVTSAAPAGGTYPSAQSVTLSCHDGAGGSGCAYTWYCLGTGCSLALYGGGPIAIASSTELRFHSRDAAGNTESPTKTVSYTICPCEVASANISLPSSAGLGRIAVTTSGCPWSAATPDSWITITAGADGSGAGTVDFSVTANNSGSPRSGSIVVGGRTVAIEQAAQPLTAGFVGIVGGAIHDNPFGPAPLEVTFDAGGSRGPLAITGYHWDFGDGTTEDSETAAVTHGYAASGSYVVTLTVTAGAQFDTAQRLVTVADEVHQVATSAELQGALTAAQANGRHDLIRVAEGSYGLSANGGAHFAYVAAAGENKDLVLEGGWAPDFGKRAYNLPSTLEYDLLPACMGDGGVLSLDGVTNATSGSFTVDALTIDGGCATGSGGGLFAVNGGGITLSNSAVTNSTASGSGGGAFLQSDGGVVWLAGCTISGNFANEAGAGVVRAPSAHIGANVIRGNFAATDGGLQARVAGGELIVGNNTVHANEAAAGSAGLAVDSDDAAGSALLDVHNNIVFGNAGAPAFAVVPDCARLADAVELRLIGNDLETSSHCADYPLDPSNVSVAPWFVTNGSGDLRLQAVDTLLIDAVTNTAVPMQDFEGDAVPLDGGSGAATADIGADEYNPTNPTGPTALGLTPAATIDAVGGGVTLTASFDLPVKRDVVLYLSHADTNADSPGQPLVTVTPPYLTFLKGTTSADVTVQALSAARHGTSLITASDPSGVLAGAGGSVTVAIEPDTAAPTGSILINNGAAYAAGTAVTLALSVVDTGGSGIGSMRFRSSDTDPYGAWEPFSATRAWTLIGGAGVKRVYAQFVDGAGNISDANPAAAGAQGYRAEIVYDPVAPTGSILINGGAASTGSAAVTLNLTAADTGGSGLRSMRFRSSATEAYGEWEPYKVTRAWTLTGGPGTRKVYAQFRDKAGNISDANAAAAGAQGSMDAIEFKEAIAPTGSILINGGAAATGGTAVTLNLSAADLGGSGLASMRFRNSTTVPYSVWEPYQGTKAWMLAGGAGTKRVYVQFTDGAGNLSDANPAAAGAQGYSDTIVFEP